MPSPTRIILLVVALLSPRSLAAQDRPPASPADINQAGPWEPLGPIPVDQAGAGRRGYVLPGESAEVAEPGAQAAALHTVAANNLYREDTGAFLITERYEAHSLAIGYRRGVTLGRFRRVEIGGQIQFNESDDGVLNGFISGFENFWASVSGRASAKTQLRDSGAKLPPLGTSVTRNGRPIYQQTGDGSGFGDVYIVAKMLVLDAAPSSTRARVAARVAVNLSGASEFTEGNFAGIGASLDKKVTEWAAFHGDARVNVLLDRVSSLGLPLRRATVAFSAGPEFKLPHESSVSLQFDGNGTPYEPTGTAAFDDDYGDVTLGLAHRFSAGRRHVLAQLYARENLNLPFRVRWNTDPDLAVGIKATLH